MADTVNGINVPFLPVGGVDGLKRRLPVEPQGTSFDTLLRQELEELTFSKHAQERLNSREIQLSISDLAQLQNAVALAEQKGAQDSLVLLRDMAFIVSVKNKTVVTAMDQQSLREHVFTNIDSAVVA
jgi:flagellar operon protein